MQQTIVTKHRTFNPQVILWGYLLLWFLLNLLFLTDFPLMHSDEAWLSGLSRHMSAEGRLDVTEPFYDLYERHPHAIKILYHLFQILFIQIFGYSLFSLRLLSLLGGVLCLYLMFQLLKSVFHHSRLFYFPLLVVIWMSWDVQFIYAAHTARQEIIMLALMLSSLILTLDGKSTAHGALTGCIIGLAAGFHPNAFLIAWPAGLLLLREMVTRKRSFLSGMAFLLTAAFTATLFVSLSFHFNPSFVQDYLSYGEPLGVMDASDVKILKWPLFYSKIFHQVGGTYYLPDIRWQFYSLPLFLLFLPLSSGRKGIIPAGLIGINLGIMILGKYSQPSVIFLIPFYYLAGAALLVGMQKISGQLQLLLILILLPLTLLLSAQEIKGELDPSAESYDEYLEQIRTLVPEESRVLGSLNLEYYLERGNLYNWRNLAFLPQESKEEEKSPFASYIHSRNINMIIIPSEIDYVYKNRPSWNALYGNTAHWYPQMEEFLEKNCVLTGSFESPSYGTRIEAYKNRKPWTVSVYRVISEDSR
ncbi:MAG: hypothetical protein B6241_05020 [Spirochaetaceae bacterium 4572_59]|nr:MAG: hypothetical protein B6241_05020 [Spirochaetaceae bacterium 4572_59]